MKLKMIFMVTIIGIGFFSYFIGEALSDYAKNNREWFEIIPETDVLVRIHNTYPNSSIGYRIKLEFYNANPFDAEVRGLKTEIIHSGKKLPIGVWPPIHVRANNNRTINFIAYKSDLDPEYFDYYADEVILKEADDDIPIYSMNKISVYDEFLYIIFKVFRYTNFNEL
jgi:hypothetical protein